MKYFNKRAKKLLCDILQFIHYTYIYKYNYRWNQLYYYYSFAEMNNITTYMLYVNLKYYYIQILKRYKINLLDDLKKEYEIDEYTEKFIIEQLLN